MKTVAATVFVCAMTAACSGSNPPTGSLSGPFAVSSAAEAGGEAVKYRFATIDDPSDPTFTEVLGINNESKLVGFYGSGGPSSPNRGFLAREPYSQAKFKTVNYPHAIDTQVSAINNKGALGGWYRANGGQRLGFMELNGIFYSYWDANAGQTTKLLAINDSFLGVGYYVTPTGRKQPFEVDVTTGKFTNLNPPRAVDAAATGITGRSDVAGWLTLSSGRTLGWLLRQGYYSEYAFPHAKSTKFLGIVIHDAIVGSYVDGAGSTHGFLLTQPLRRGKTAWQRIDEPNAAYGTVVTAINSHRELAGYYVDSNRTTHGFLAVPPSEP